MKSKIETQLNKLGKTISDAKAHSSSDEYSQARQRLDIGLVWMNMDVKEPAEGSEKDYTSFEPMKVERLRTRVEEVALLVPIAPPFRWVVLALPSAYLELV